LQLQAAQSALPWPAGLRSNARTGAALCVLQR